MSEVGGESRPQEAEGSRKSIVIKEEKASNGTHVDHENMLEASPEVEPSNSVSEGAEFTNSSSEAERTTEIKTEAEPTKSNHIRTNSKVEVIEAPERLQQRPLTITSDTQSASIIPPAPSKAASIHPDTAEHRQSDNPASYQSKISHSYLNLRAMALQLPNNINIASSSTHIEPPTLILEGRTNLSSARRSYYPKVTRTLPELHLWLLSLTLSFPASIFSPFTYPPITLLSNSTATDAAIRDYMTTITNQFERILSKSYVLSHPATIALVDCDFNYLPSLPHIGPGSSQIARRKMEEGVKIARAGFDPLKGRKGGMTSTWDAEGVAAALGLPPSALPNYNEASSSNIAAASRNPLSIFTRANASPQRIQVAPLVALPPGEEDDDEEDLTLARNEITRLEMQFEKASLAAQMVVDKSGAMNAILNQLIQALTHLEQLDSGRLIARRAKEEVIIQIMTRGIEGWAASENGINSTIISTIIPSMSYQSYNARMAIDALLRRAAAATHRHSALVVLVQKRREAERLKRARGEIRQDEVDWVLSELKEAQRTTNLLTHHLATFTATLKDELKYHSKSTHSDVQNALLNHARSSIKAHKFLLNSLTKARDDMISRKEGKVVQTNSALTMSQVREIDSTSTTVEKEIPASAPAPTEASTDLTAADEPVEEMKTEITVKSLAADTDKVLPVTPINDSQSSSAIVDAALQSMNREEVATPIVSVEISTPTAVETLCNMQETDAKENRVSQSTTLNPTIKSSLSHDADATPTMSQSAFLPARNMNRYANPFARLDQGSPSAPNLGQGKIVASNGSTTPPVSSQEPPKAKVNDVWANRSRLSASDAARSLAGRF